MSQLLKLLVAFLLCQHFCAQVDAQSKPFSNYFQFNANEGPFPSSYPRFIGLRTKEPDLLGKGRIFYYTGEPTRPQIQDEILNPLRLVNNISGYGLYYVTTINETPIPFNLSYGYLTSGSTFRYDKIALSIGSDIGQEGPRVELPSRQSESGGFWCDVFDLDCNISQNIDFAFPRNSIYSNSASHHVQLLFIRFYMQGQVVETVVFPILITGSREIPAGTTDAFQLHTILRPPPGDASSATIVRGSSITNETSFSLSESDTKGSSQRFSAGVSIGKGLFEGTGTMAEYETSTEYTETNNQGNSVLSSFTTTSEIKAEKGSDVFVVEKFRYDFGFKFTVTADATTTWVQANGDTRMTMYPNRLLSQHVWSEENLINNLIPRADLAGRRSEANYQRSLIDLNRRLKDSASDWKTLEFTGTRFSESFQSDLVRTESISQELTLEESEQFKIENKLGINIGPISIGGSASATISKTHTITQTTSNLNSISNTQIISYTVDDDDDDDYLLINAKKDLVFGTLVFSLDESKSMTSCPYEGGIMRDNPSITVKDPITGIASDFAKMSSVPIDGQAAFQLMLRNNSAEDRYYVLSQNNNNAKLTIGGLNNSNDPKLIKSGDSIEIIVVVERLANLPTVPLAYDDIQFIMSAACDATDRNSVDNSVADTVLLQVFFGGSDVNRPPDNDAISKAFLLPADGSLKTEYRDQFDSIRKISNRNASAMPGEQLLAPPADCSASWCSETDSGLAEISASVWFKFVSISPEVVISTCDATLSTFNSQMAVYKVGDPTDLNSFTLIAANEDGCNANGPSWLYFDNLTVGDTFYIMIDGYKGAEGDFGIRITSPPPGNDNSCNADFLTVNGLPNQGSLPLGKGPDFQYSNYQATIEENEMLIVPDTGNAVTAWKENTIQHTVWFAFVAPKGGAVIIDLLNANFDAQIAVYGTEGNICGPAWFSTYLLLGANDDRSPLGGFDSRLVLSGLDPGTRYLIMVDGNADQMGSFDITLSIPTPINDQPCAAITLETNGYAQGPFSNGGATASLEEQSIAPPYSETGENGWGDVLGEYRVIEKSVWFKFIAPSSGSVIVSTCDQTDFIAQFATYKVLNCNDFGTFNYISSDDNSGLCARPPDSDNPNGSNRRGSIDTLNGLMPDSTYYLLVDGAILDFGTFYITLTTPPSDPPVNDEVCNAIMLPTNGVIQTGFNNLGATVTELETSIAPDNQWADASINSSVWFTFVAPTSGEVEISTCDLANFDSQVAVFTATDCSDFNTFSLVAANEDGPDFCATRGDNFLPVPGLNAGQAYYLVIDGYGNLTGNFSIVIRDEITPGPIYDHVMEAILLPVNGVVQKGFTNVLATAEALEQSIKPEPPSLTDPDCINGWCDDQVDNSVWFKFVAPEDGKVNISTCDLATFDTQLALFAASDVSDFNTFVLIAANDAGPIECATNFDSYLPVEGLDSGQTYYIMVDGFNGDMGNFDISLTGTDAVTSIAESTIAGRLKVYPNPFNDRIYLEYSKDTPHPTRVEVVDLRGRKITGMQQPVRNIDNLLELDLSSVPKGMFLMVIHTDSGIVTKKIVKY